MVPRRVIGQVLLRLTSISLFLFHTSEMSAHAFAWIAYGRLLEHSDDAPKIIRPKSEPEVFKPRSYGYEQNVACL